MSTIYDKLNQKGRTVIVTGGYRGIGLGIVRNFAAAGADIAICGRNAEAGEKVAEELRADHVNCRFYTVDITDCVQIDNFVENVVRDFGKIDILVNNSGITDHTAAENINVSQYDRLMNTNVRGTFFMSTAVGRHMIERQIRGSIVMVASMSAFLANIPQKQTTYNMSKAAICSMTQCLAVEWAEHGIRVNAICPGYIQTEMLTEDLAAAWRSMTPMGHFGEVDDVGAAVLFLASDASAYMTGSRVIMDGGYSCI